MTYVLQPFLFLVLFLVALPLRVEAADQPPPKDPPKVTDKKEDEEKKEPERLVPCLEEVRGRWTLSKKDFCRQLSVDQLRENNKRLLELRHYRETVSVQAKKTADDLDRLVKISDADRERFDKTTGMLKTEIDIRRQEAAKWRIAYEDLRKQPPPPLHWSQHPAFWFGVGFLVAGTAAGVTAIVLLTQKNP